MTSPGPTSASLADRQRAWRRAGFVGRRDELGLARAMFRGEPPGAQVLYVHGPGGVGKSALLEEAAARAAEDGADVARIDACASGDDVAELEERLRAALATARPCLIVDHVEAQPGLGEWLRAVFLPTLPAAARALLATRDGPSLAWRTMPGWGAFVVEVALRNLSPEESRALLRARGVAEADERSVLEFTRGHPLALTLAAEVARSGGAFSPAAAPDVVRELLAQLVGEVVAPGRRAALEACAVARVTDEALLGELTGDRSAFDWLAALPFVVASDDGLVPHDTVRQVVTHELRWRDPPRYADLVGRLLRLGIRRLEGPTADRPRIFRDLFFVFRSLWPTLDEAAFGAEVPAWTGAPSADERGAILDIVERHEGAESRAIAAHWAGHPAATTLVARNAAREPIGFATWLSLGRTTAKDRRVDPALGPAFAHLRANAPLREGEDAEYLRFHMARETHHRFSPHYFWLSARIFERCFARRAAFTFTVTSVPELLEITAAMQGTVRLQEADFVVGGRRFALFGHDWRITPYSTWIELSQRSLLLGAPSAPTPAEELLVLSLPDFADGVKDALRGLADPARLAGSPLLRSRMVVEHVGKLPGADGDRASALGALLRTSIARLGASPRTRHLEPVLRLTYLEPREKQFAAACELGLPFSTYRLHLATGVKRVIEELWAAELGRGLAAGPIDPDGDADPRV